LKQCRTRSWKRGLVVNRLIHKTYYYNFNIVLIYDIILATPSYEDGRVCVIADPLLGPCA